MSDILQTSHTGFTDIVHYLIASGRTGKDNYRFYGEFALFINFIQDNSPSMPTAGVWVDHFMNMAYNKDFIGKQNQKQVAFILFHEIFHLLYKHPARTNGRFDHRMANIAQDMIINTSIIEDIPSDLVQVPVFENIQPDGTIEQVHDAHMEMPPEYTDDRIFEVLYVWLMDQKKKADAVKKENRKNQKRIKQENEDNGHGSSYSGEGEGSGSSQKGEKKDPNAEDKDPYEGMSKELKKAIKTHSNGKKVIFDVHMSDKVPDELRDQVVSNAIERLKQRGFVHGNIEATLKKLRKSKKNYLPSLRRGISQIKSKVKVKTYTRVNRRGITGLKGNKKQSHVVNCLLDVSGSMSGCFNKVLSYMFHDNFMINLIQCDTEVTQEIMVVDKKHLNKIRIKGLGGTTLQPGLDLIKKKYNSYNTVILTDGYTDQLNVNGCGKVLIITTDTPCPIAPESIRKPRQIVIKGDDNG